MPKRKAQEASSADSAVKSPTRKKSKKEALAAAKEWHDKRAKSGVGVSSSVEKVTTKAQQAAASGSTEGKPAAKSVATGKNTIISKKQQILSNKVPSKSPLVAAEVKPSKSKGALGGNAFLKSLREEKKTPTTSSKEGEVSMYGEPVAVAESPNCSATSSAINLQKQLGNGEFKMVLILLVLNVVFAIYMMYFGLNVSSNNYSQEQYESEVERLKTELSKTLEVEALLRSGIDVLDQELKLNKNGMKDLRKVHTLYGIQLEHDDHQGLQSSEEKDAWLKSLSEHDSEKNNAVADWLVSVTALNTGDGKKRYDYI